MIPLLRSSPLLLLSAVGVRAQAPGALLTFSQTEYTQSLGGGPLATLQPNEISFLPLPLGCSNGHLTEKWSPRTCFDVMAGDENGDTQYWNPNLFGSIDALAGIYSNFGWEQTDPRNVFWSPSAAMGTNISGSPLRPGDIGRIVKGGGGDGEVDLLMSQEQFNIAIGLPPGNPIDIDAFAYEPGLGIYFSVDNHLFLANPACAPNTLIADGDLLAIPDSAITWSLNYRVLSVAPSSAHVVIGEAQFGAMLANSQIADRNGAPITTAIDLESLDIYSGQGSGITLVNTCSGQVAVPDFVFATESMTGGSLATTVGGGQPYYSACGTTGYQVPQVQNGSAVGIQGSPFQGPPSHVNALLLTTTKRFVLEPDVHQQNYSLLGGPPTTVHIGAEFVYVFTWVDLAPATVPTSFFIPPFSPNCFPDWYCPNLTLWQFHTPVTGFASFATVPIPVGWSGKLLFQSIGFDAPGVDFEVSTPCVIDVN